LTAQELQRTQLTGISNLSEERDPNRVAEIILRPLSESDFTEEEIVESFTSAVFVCRKNMKASTSSNNQQEPTGSV
jgi:hypothetical protein